MTRRICILLRVLVCLYKVVFCHFVEKFEIVLENANFHPHLLSLSSFLLMSQFNEICCRLVSFLRIHLINRSFANNLFEFANLIKFYKMLYQILSASFLMLFFLLLLLRIVKRIVDCPEDGQISTLSSFGKSSGCFF